jgi:Secretion system C-terminal sorting domain
MVFSRVKETDISMTSQRQFLPGIIKLMYLILSMVSFYTAGAQNVIMQHNDMKRTGWDAGETILTQTNVSGGTFGKIFQLNVDDQIYSQPLIVNNVMFGGHLRNIVIVTTVNNSVYAFDADTGGTAYWHVNLTPSNYRPVQASDMCNSNSDAACGAPGHYLDFAGKMGIVGTPAIDPSGNGIIYVVAKSVTGHNAGDCSPSGTYVQYLHALNLIDGTEKANSPVSISASVTTANNVTTNFDPRLNNQRPALLLLNGVVYITWASHCDWDSYHGWIIGYDATSLSQKYVYNDTEEGIGAGIWMSGQGPSVDDAGNIYVSTGNGTTGNINAVVNPGSNPNYPLNRASSLIKLNQNLTMSDFFTPYDYDSLNNNDLDYGVDGVLVIPNTNLTLSGSKESFLYLVNTNPGSMGQTASGPGTPPNSLQMLNVNATYNGKKHLHGSPVYFKDNNGKEYIYAWAEDGFLKQFPLLRSAIDPADSSKFDTPNTIVGNTVLPVGMPGAMLSVSSNGSTTGTGIIWASHPINGDANQGNVPGIVQAFDATDVSHELWNSNLNGLRDSIGTFGKFVPPTIANGKLYMATFSGSLKVYGLNAPVVTSCNLPATPVQTPPWTSGDIGYVSLPGDACYTTPNNGTFTVTSTGTDFLNNVDGFHFVFQSVAGNQMQIIAHLVSMTNTVAGAKAGIIFRSNLDPGSPNILLALVPGLATYSWSNRQTQNAMANVSYGPTNGGQWLKLSALGNVFSAYTSPDGSTWAPAGSITLSLGTNIYGGLAYTTTNNTTLGTAVFDNVSVTYSGTLPVTLIDFTAYNRNNQYSQLYWTTSAETDFNFFDIERSTPNTDFISVGTVAGNGNSQVDQQYNFIDNNPADGDNYYRLKMVDKDGKFVYSKTVKVNLDLSIMSLYPNPAKDRVYLKNNLHFTNGEQITVEMINTLGQQLLIESINTNGQDLTTINFPSGIKSGVYYLKATNSKGQKQNWKILVKN